MNFLLDELILIKNTRKTARIIEIYAVPGQNDRIFTVKFPDTSTSYVFESQALRLCTIDKTA